MTNTPSSAAPDTVVVPLTRDWQRTLSTRERTVSLIGALPESLTKADPFPGEPDDRVVLTWDEQADGPEPGSLYVRDLVSGLVLVYRGDTAQVLATES